MLSGKWISAEIMQNPQTTDFPDAMAPASERLEGQVYRTLFDKIRFGGFEMGQKLPSEAELCEQYGVSRPVVRAALAKLRDSGLIVSRQGAGSFVNSGVPANAAGFAPLASISDIATYFDFRRTIEASGAELAAANATDRDIAVLRGIADDMRGVLAKGGDSVGLDIKLHTKIAELSDNRFLIETLEMLRPHWIFVGKFVCSLGATGQRKGIRMMGEHTAIIDTLEAGDARAARKAMLVHVDGSERRVFKGRA